MEEGIAGFHAEHQLLPVLSAQSSLVTAGMASPGASS